MSFLTDAARGVTALGLASQLPPASAVSFTPDIICAVMVSVAMLVCCFAVIKTQDTKKDATSKGVPALGEAIAYGLLVSAIIGCVAGIILHQIRWNVANPEYYAAEQGLNVLFGHG